MPHTITRAELLAAGNAAGKRTDEFILLVDYTELRRAFAERTEALTRSADECIRLTNERDALINAVRDIIACCDANDGDSLANAVNFARSLLLD